MKIEHLVKNDTDKEVLGVLRTKELRALSGNVVSSDRLVGFLYELMRDHLSAGAVEQLVRDQIGFGELQFTNGYLASYAKNLAELLQTKNPTEDNCQRKGP